VASIIVNQMVDKNAALDRVFRALASQPRREILRRVAKERRTVTELAEHFDMSLAAVSKHVGVLHDAKLLVQTREGRVHWCRLDPSALEPARASIEELRSFWNDRLDGLERFLATGSPKSKRTRTTRRRVRA
jgi:DNA-binding transcriptional ArsR family regulator